SRRSTSLFYRDPSSPCGVVAFPLVCLGTQFWQLEIVAALQTARLPTPIEILLHPAAAWLVAWSDSPRKSGAGNCRCAPTRSTACSKNRSDSSISRNSLRTKAGQGFGRRSANGRIPFGNHEG